jgi:hypothetical protein
MAQKVTIGPKLGVNLSTLSDVDDAESRVGLHAGGFLVYSIVEHFGISLDIVYSQQGANSKTSNSELHLDYIQIPLLANIFFNKYGDDFRPKIVVGPALGILASAKGQFVEKDDFNSTDFGIVAGLGFNYKVGEKKWLNVDARYGMGASEIFKEDIPGMDVKNSYIAITVGLGFGMSEE